MQILADVAAIVVFVACAVTATAHDRRFAILGLAVALLAAPLVAVPWPGFLPLAFRLVAALTGTYLLWVAATRRGESRDVATGAGVHAAAFVAAAFVGVALLAPGLGPERGSPIALASAAGAGVAALSLGVAAPSALAGGLSAILLVLSASLATAGLIGAPASLEHAVVGAALLAVTTAAALLGAGGSVRIASAAPVAAHSGDGPPAGPIEGTAAPAEAPAVPATPPPEQSGLFDEGGD